MPVTRSASRQKATENARPYHEKASAGSATESKSKPVKKAPRGRKKQQATGVDATSTAPSLPETAVVTKTIVPVVGVQSAPPELLPAILTFSLDEAKQHLITADPRFEDLFDRLKCRPWEQLERVDPFRCGVYD